MIEESLAPSRLQSVPNNYISHIKTDNNMYSKIKNRIERYTFSNTFKFEIKVTYIKLVHL